MFTLDALDFSLCLFKKEMSMRIFRSFSETGPAQKMSYSGLLKVF